MRYSDGKPLLPSNANSFEKALSLATHFGEDLLPEDIRNLWRPGEIPTKFLPFLAWGLHVDFWRDSLSDEAKRNLISGSYEWHRLEGTFGAIRRICDAVFGKTEVQAWHQYGGEPYGFKVITEGRITDSSGWTALHEAIWSAQALRDSLDGIEIRRRLNIQLYHGIGACRSGEKRIGLPPLKARYTNVYFGCAAIKRGKKSIGLYRKERLEAALGSYVVTVKRGVKVIGLSEAGRLLANT